MGKRVAVTGATGFIGRAICRELHEQGYAVRALVRSPSRAKRLGDSVDELVRGDIDSSDALEELLKDVFAVVHCVGAVRGVDQQAFDRVNVEGLKKLVEAVTAAGKPKLLCLSSLAAREPELSFYSRSKWLGEQVLLQHAGHLDWIALRPPAVYGPGDKELLPLFQLMAKGFAPLPGRPDARFSMIFVDDIARLVSAWLRQDRIPRGVYSVHDGRPGGYSWDEVIAAVSRQCQRRVRALTIPVALLAVAARVNRALAKWIGYAPMLTPEKLRELRHPDWVCDNDAIEKVLDWQPETQLEEGLRNTPGWCQVKDQS